MKILLFIFLTTICLYAQQDQYPLAEDEIIINLINWSGEVTIAADRITDQPKWLWNLYTFSGDLIGGNSYDNVTSNNLKLPENVYRGRVIFDTEGDQNPDKTLALSIYRISNNESGKNAYFYINTLSCVQRDREFTYDPSADKFYYGLTPPFNSANEVSNGATINLWGYQETGCLELYLTVTSQNGHPYAEWNPTKQTSWTGYKIYRSINMQGGGPGSFGNISTVGKYDNTFIDED